ncbi:magnesium-transporting ATPase (P-type) [Priestia aryabhattai]|uniref:hypothetical protein n=1 Tax=Priestia aryabhattai TaxID=412384 RepID=UPI0027E52454|nr:hypothetical protein [Priestia aryabhattai]MDP9727048.1 magnesium-transporting ATPase (P-type) [Priestia aryabhattai]
MKNIKDLLSNTDLAFLLTISAVGGYGLFYTYSLGMYKHYKIPIAFIELNTRVLTGAVLFALFMLLTFLITVVILNNDFKERRKHGLPLKSALKPIVIGAIIVCPIIILFSLVIVKLSLKTTLIIGTFPVWTLMISIALIQFKKYLHTVVVLIIFSLGYSFLLGQATSEERAKYYIVTQEKAQPYVMLGMFQNQYIIAPVDLKKRSIIPAFRLIETKSEKGNKVELKYMNIGKMKVERYAE